MAHTALASMISVGRHFEWIDTSDIHCIHHCTQLKAYSSIGVDLLYKVRTSIWLFIFVCTVIF